MVNGDKHITVSEEWKKRIHMLSDRKNRTISNFPSFCGSITINLNQEFSAEKILNKTTKNWYDLCFVLVINL